MKKSIISLLPGRNMMIVKKGYFPPAAEIVPAGGPERILAASNEDIYGWTDPEEDY